MVDIGTFFIQRAIIHRIPKAKLTEKAEYLVTFSDLPSSLNDVKRAYFRNRIVRSLQKAFAVERDPSETSPVPQIMLDHFGGSGGDDDFVKMSQGIAQHLHESQGGSSPSGLVAVIEGTIGTGRSPGRCIAVLKLEMEPGVHVEQVTIDGKTTFDVTLEEVTLTETTRVFKASLFPRFTSLPTMSGSVSDDQLDSATIGREIAEFFLRFLGCKIRETPSVRTKHFMDQTTTFLNSVEDQDAKLRYEVAMRAELESNSPTLNPQTFAERHLDLEDQDRFVAEFAKEDGTVDSFTKDVELVRSRIGKTWVEFDNGVRVTGPPDAVSKSVAAIRTAIDTEGEKLVDANIRRVR